MLIKVKQAHIDFGVRNSPISCPIARAVRDAFGIDDGVVVGEHSINISNEKTTTRYNVPANVKIFIQRFDSEKAIEPFEFELG